MFTFEKVNLFQSSGSYQNEKFKQKLNGKATHTKKIYNSATILFTFKLKIIMNPTTDRKKSFAAIDKNGNGIIEFKEWYKHFDALIRAEGSTWTAEKLLALYKSYEGEDKGINLEEYSTFMDEVFGKVEKPKAKSAATDRKKSFDAIDKNGNGTIEFKEWYKHFDALIRAEGSTWTAEKLLALYKSYEGEDKGINLEEYTAFMDDVFGKA